MLVYIVFCIRRRYFDQFSFAFLDIGKHNSGACGRGGQVACLYFRHTCFRVCFVTYSVLIRWIIDLLDIRKAVEGGIVIDLFLVFAMGV